MGFDAAEEYFLHLALFFTSEKLALKYLAPKNDPLKEFFGANNPMDCKKLFEEKI